MPSPHAPGAEESARSAQKFVVLKFGGTSVSTLERWQTVADILRATRAESTPAQNVRPFVVCSALSGISNLLEELARLAPAGEYAEVIELIRKRHHALAGALGVDAEDTLGAYFEALDRMALGASLTGEVSPKLHARIMALGELMSTRLGAAYLQNCGLSVTWRDARTMLLASDEPHTNLHRHYLSAACQYAPDAELRADLGKESAEIVLTQGFIARDALGDTVLLGRGRSEEHTSELQSRPHLVCRLLLEKKKNKHDK